MTALATYRGVPVREVEVVPPSTTDAELSAMRMAELEAQAARRVEAIRELAEMIAHGGDAVSLAVGCVEMLEDLGWSDD